jgi:hypothetical protein
LGGGFENYFLIKIGFYGKSLKWRKAGFRRGGPEGEESCHEEGSGKAGLTLPLSQAFPAFLQIEA